MYLYQFLTYVIEFKLKKKFMYLLYIKDSDGKKIILLYLLINNLYLHVLC